MQALKQLGGGFLLGILSVALVLGGFAIAMAEGGMIPSFEPTSSPTAVFPTIFPTLPLLSSTEQNSAVNNPTIAVISTQTSTPPAPPTSCPPPAGWVAIIVQPYDTLNSLAQTFRISPSELQHANCLIGSELASGSFLYVPHLPTATNIPCGAPFGWITYLVQPGDTLYKISLLYRVSVTQLQNANCLGASTYIYTGQSLKVPNVSTSTATFTPPIPVTDTATFTSTFTLTPSPPVTTTEPPPSPTNTPPVETATTPPSSTPENTATTAPPPTQELSPTP